MCSCNSIGEWKMAEVGIRDVRVKAVQLKFHSGNGNARGRQQRQKNTGCAAAFSCKGRDKRERKYNNRCYRRDGHRKEWKMTEYTATPSIAEGWRMREVGSQRCKRDGPKKLHNFSMSSS